MYAANQQIATNRLVPGRHQAHPALLEKRMWRDVGPQADLAPTVQSGGKVGKGAFGAGMRVVKATDDVQRRGGFSGCHEWHYGLQAMDILA